MNELGDNSEECPVEKMKRNITALLQSARCGDVSGFSPELMALAEDVAKDLDFGDHGPQLNSE